MSESFAPCPSCRRHVRARAEGCPFCGTPLDAASQGRQVRPGVDPRLSRAAALVAAAALTVSACGDDEGQVVTPVYGAPAAGASGQGGGGGAGGSSAGGAGGKAGSFDGGSAGTIYGVPVYGGPPAGSGGQADAGAAGSGDDAGMAGAAPHYGLPPAGSGGAGG